MPLEKRGEFEFFHVTISKIVEVKNMSPINQVTYLRYICQEIQKDEGRLLSLQFGGCSDLYDPCKKQIFKRNGHSCSLQYRFS